MGLSDAGLYLSPVDGGLRAAGTVELAGLDAKPNPKRLDYIEQPARRALPSLKQRGDTWLGFRPTFPDALPVIGHSSKHPSVSTLSVISMWGLRLALSQGNWSSR